MTAIFNRTDHKEKRRSLRQQIPPSERMLWARLRNRQVCGLKFRRQFGINRFVVDFYCAEALLAIEVDGYSHSFEQTDSIDQDRQRYLDSLGITVLRFTHDHVGKQIDMVVEQIASTARKLGCAEVKPHPNPLLRKEREPEE